MKSNYKSFLIFLVMVVSLFFFIPKGKNQKCLWQEDFESIKFSGVVIKKYIDSSQHSSPILEIEDLITGKINTIYLFGDRSNTFEYLNRSDTIFKEAFSSRIQVKRNGTFEDLAFIDFGCGN